MNLFVLAVAALTELVPAPREYSASEGVLVIEPKLKYALSAWYDFDRAGQAFAEM